MKATATATEHEASQLQKNSFNHRSFVLVNGIIIKEATPNKINKRQKETNNHHPLVQDT
jgi:hypothetical protein